MIGCTDSAPLTVFPFLWGGAAGENLPQLHAAANVGASSCRSRTNGAEAEKNNCLDGNWMEVSDKFWFA